MARRCKVGTSYLHAADDTFRFIRQTRTAFSAALVTGERGLDHNSCGLVVATADISSAYVPRHICIQCDQPASAGNLQRIYSLEHYLAANKGQTLKAYVRHPASSSPQLRSGDRSVDRWNG